MPETSLRAFVSEVILSNNREGTVDYDSIRMDQKVKYCHINEKEFVSKSSILFGILVYDILSLVHKNGSKSQLLPH